MKVLQEKQRMVVGLSQEIERLKQPEEQPRKRRIGISCCSLIIFMFGYELW